MRFYAKQKNHTNFEKEPILVVANKDMDPIVKSKILFDLHRQVVIP